MGKVINGITEEGKNAADIATLTQEVDTHMAESATNIEALQTEKADQTSLNATNAIVETHTSQISSLSSGSPKGVYATVAALTAAIPAGDDSIYVVTADGKWYYWNGSAWTAGGVYQSTGLGLGSVTGAALNTQYDFKAYINAGEDLDDIIDAGSYLVGTALNKPVATTCIMTIKRVNTRWVIQSVHGWSNPSDVYYRLVDTTGSAGEWKKSVTSPTDFADSSIPNSKLSNTFAYSGSLGASDDANNVQKNGMYVYSGTANTITGSGILIHYGGTGIAVQICIPYYLDGSIYTRRRSSARVWTEYYNTNDSVSFTSPLDGKKCVCFGDSLMEGGTIHTHIANTTGMTTYNVGFGGCTMANHTSTNYDKFSMTKLAHAIATGVWTDQDAAAVILDAEGDDMTPTLEILKGIDFSTIDFITIFYGTNDFTGEVPIGVNTDADSTTFKGAINYITDELCTAFPNLKIFFIAPCWRSRLASGDGKDADTNTNEDGRYLLDYVDAEIEMARLNKMPCLDMYRTSGINKYNAAAYLVDGLHGTEAGYERMGKHIASFILSNY